MDIGQIRAKARALGINVPGGAHKEDIIRKIQEMEGNFICFGTAGDDYCDQQECCWREDCLSYQPRPPTNIN